MSGPRLSDEERRMLDGAEGPACQRALEFIVRFAEVIEAEDLCPVTWADLFCGAHGYLSVAGTQDFDRVFSALSLCATDTVPLDRMHAGCVCYSGVEADCGEVPGEMLMGPRKRAWDLSILRRFARAGVVLSGNCIPYLTGFVPVMGEHFVSCESSAVLFMNSLWGACGNGDGIQASFCAAVCGRTPRHGLHLSGNRRATVRVDVRSHPRSVHDWDLLGYAIGRKLPPMAVPLLTGDFARPGAIALKAFFAALACAAGTEMCHIEGLTPEARTADQALGGRAPDQRLEITAQDTSAALESLNGHPRRKIDYVTLGCPHYHIEEIRGIAETMEGKRVAADTVVHLWTAGSIRYSAERSGYLDRLKRAGIRVLTGSCPATRGYPDGVGTAAYDSAKQRLSANQEFGGAMYYGSLEACLRTAISGYWEGR